ANGRVEGVLVRGNRIQDIRTKPILNGKVIAGDLKAVTPGSGRVAVGARLAETLGAFPGSEISLISPEGRSTPVGTVPRIVTYTVGAIFEVGIFEYDKAFVIMPMQDAQTLLLLGDQVGMVEIQTTNPDKVGEILAPLQPLIRGKGIIADWRQMNSALFEALEVERIAMFVVLCIIILVAAFNIASSLIMLVRAKTRDIAILRTMGASRASMTKIFMTVGLTIGSFGIVIGAILGAIFLFFRQGVVNFIQLVTGQNLWDPSVRFLSELPSKTDPFEVAAIVLVTLVLTYLATLFPARNAAATDPVQVLRYE
ncbi:MAG: FtsX-like permease family protein, partial [Sphingomicrobium sp.]